MWFWIRRLVRRRMKPIPLNTAENWHRRLTILYGVIAWNTAGFILYLAFSGRLKKSPENDKRTSAEYYADVLGIKKAQVIQITGFKKVGAFEIDKTEEDSTEVHGDGLFLKGLN